MAEGGSPDPFATLSFAVDVLGTAAALPGRPTFDFVFTLFRPDPLWRADLNAFPILRYQGARAIPPDGTPATPFVIAVNGAQADDTQILAATNYLVGILRRQTAVAQVLRNEAPLESLQGAAENLDSLSRVESFALARAVKSGRHDEVELVLSRWGYGITTRLARSWLDQAAFSSRVPFLARAYNSLDIAREAIDRVVSATTGVGPRVSGPSEEVRSLVEHATTDTQVAAFTAHAVRDTLLTGVSALVTRADQGLPQLRLVRPDQIELLPDANGHAVIERREGGPVERIEAQVLVGTEQPGVLYGASILEPFAMTLHTALDLLDSAREMESKLPPEDQWTPAARSLANTVETSRGIGQAAQESLRDLLGPIFTAFAPPRYPLYLRGHERWP